MDTIRNYLENMFLALPQTPEVLRAKEELYTMMEDKYLELKASGKTENEAIGIVIAEFGNLEELAETLGLNSHMGAASQDDSWQYENMRTVTMDETDDYLRMSHRSAAQVAAGVMLCIFSPILLIFLCGVAEMPSTFLSIQFSENIAVLVGLLALFLTIAIAVVLFITNGLRQKPYAWMEKESFHMEDETLAYLQQRHSQFRSGFIAETALGVTFCILSVIPLLVCGLLLDPRYEFLTLISVCLLLLLVGIGVFLLVHAGMLSDSYKILLQQEEYSRQRKENQVADALLRALNGSYWSIVTLIYLGISFAYGNWHISWLIWIVAGILQPILISIVKAFRAGK